ncbi:P-loop containing nucleoside triphosphate hydrolase protein [Mycena rosella]|uniref:P-loop containing nucleoside triphosphate hydrolase protein n=1 Tax=Mycena rosella TaxID=1033263 RepID=A0AAD7MCL4_MYCRO|nr:P-loop containing nucleoside triphosphate hydrolase protein [Mycena rosella]
MPPKQRKQRKQQVKPTTQDDEDIVVKVRKPEALAFMLYILLDLYGKEDTTRRCFDDLVLENGATYKEPFLLALEHANFPPVWLEEPPEDFKPEWGDHWDDIREPFTGEQPTDVITLARFKWDENRGQRYFLEKAILNKWQGVWDGLFHDCLKKCGMTIRQVYLSDAFKVERSKGKWPAARHLLNHYRDIVTEIFGSAVCGDLGVVECCEKWWNHQIAKAREAAQKKHRRAVKKMKCSEEHAIAALGKGFLEGDADAASKFSVSECVLVLGHLRGWLDGLSWNVLDAQDRSALSVETANTPDAVKALYASLTPAAKDHERCTRMLGCMAALLEKRKVKSKRAQSMADIEPDLDPHQLAGFRRGVVMANAWSAANLGAIREVSAADAAAFDQEMANFVTQWSGRTTGPPPDKIASLLMGFEPESFFEEMGSASQLGTTALLNTQSPAELQEYLGIQDCRPMAFRRHVAQDPTAYKSGQDIDIPGITREFQLHHHQMVAVAAILNNAMHPRGATDTGQQSKRTWTASDLSALRFGWDKLGGMLLADEMGIGKTFVILALIGVLIQIIAFEQNGGGVKPLLLVKKAPTRAPTEDTSMPDANEASAMPAAPIGRGLGFLQPIPLHSHLIVVPNSLVNQWVTQMRRVYTDIAVTIIQIDSNEATWAKNFKSIPNQPEHRRIYICSFTTMTRMAKEAVELVGNFPRVKASFRNKETSIFGHQWLSIYFDESHELRTGLTAWRAAYALMSLALIKTIGTATPVIEGLTDILNLARLIRPYELSTVQDLLLTKNLALMRKLRNKTLRLNTRPDELAAFMTSATVSAGARAGALSEQTPEQTLYQQAHLQVTRDLKMVTCDAIIRRTGQSLDYEGKELARSIPPLTVIHAVLNLTDEEVKTSKQLEESDVGARGPGGKLIEGAGTTRRHQNASSVVFYSLTRAYNSFPPRKERWPLLTIQNAKATEVFSKLRYLGEMVVGALIEGPETIVAPTHHGSRTAMLGNADINVADVTAEGYRAREFPRDQTTTEKVVVFTVFQVFHAHMESYLTSLGLKVRTVSGNLSTKARTKAIQEFKDSDDHVLIISNVGAVGLDLTFARTLILYEVNWSGVLAGQIYGRIHRPGQDKPSFAFQLVGKNTVDTLLAMVASNKAKIAEDYITPAEREAYLRHFKKVFMSGDDDDDEGDEDEEDVMARLAAAVKPGRKRSVKRKAEREEPESEDEPPAPPRPESGKLADTLRRPKKRKTAD